jgi:hypothetical protein
MIDIEREILCDCLSIKVSFAITTNICCGCENMMEVESQQGERCKL